jgi:malate synthase A
MDEILYELRDHICGLNAGRWDYIFSVAKRFHADPAFVLPDRSLVTMTTPFMRAYTELLVQTCHRRGAHAIGGMAAFIPNRRKPEVTETALAKVAEDKKREAADGFDGTWVAHPDLVPTAMAEFDASSVANPISLTANDLRSLSARPGCSRSTTRGTGSRRPGWPRTSRSVSATWPHGWRAPARPPSTT